MLAGSPSATVRLIPVVDPVGVTDQRSMPLPLPECADCRRPLRRGRKYAHCPHCDVAPVVVMQYDPENDSYRRRGEDRRDDRDLVVEVKSIADAPPELTAP